MVKRLRRILPSSAKMIIREHFPNRFFGNQSYSQEGEDIVLMRMFDSVRRGFYVDVGAHHPFRFSNTCLFYKRGWRGIAVDPLPGVTVKFSKYRPRDIVIEKGVSSHSGVLKYHVFNEEALNTFDESLAAERKNSPRWQLRGVISVECMTLQQILDIHLPPGLETINFLSVDVEGHDLLVLKSSDWARYRPEAVVVECLNASLDSLSNDPIVEFMKSVDYSPIAKTFHSVIFQRKS